MGEIADMMLTGVLCAGCGITLEENIELDEDELPGYPCYCEGCGGEGFE